MLWANAGIETCPQDRDTVLGFRPRRDTLRPGPPSLSASASVTSNSITPLRASAKTIRIVAPFPSVISPPPKSDTRRLLHKASGRGFYCWLWFGGAVAPVLRL